MDSHERAACRPTTPRTPEQVRARALAGERRDAMRRRTRAIRRAVAGLAAVLFSTAFLVIYVQLASGHDPALAASTKRATTAATHGTTASSSSAAESSGSESSGESSSSGGESSNSAATSDSASAVTTSQS